MGCGASADLRYAAPNSDVNVHSPITKKIAPFSSTSGDGDIPWNLPEGGCVVALFDFDPSLIDWPLHWGTPLQLSTSMVVEVTGDEGNEIAYGYPIKQPRKQGYFPKRYAMPLADCLRPSELPTIDSSNFGNKDMEQYNFHPHNSYDGIGACKTVKHYPGSTRGVSDTHPSSKNYPGTCAPSILHENVRNHPIPPAAALQRRFPHSAREPIRINDTGDQFPSESPSQALLRPLPKATDEASKMPSDHPRGLRSSKGITAIAKNDATSQIEKSLGLKEGCDESFRWLVDFAAAGDLPSDWERFFDDEGREAFYHPATKRVSRQHPTMMKYKHFLKKLRAFHERSGISAEKVRPHMALMLNEMLNRCHKELPPVTPELVERIAVLLNIDTAFEHTLTGQLKLLIEAYVEDQYDIAVQVREKLDVDSFISQMRKRQVEIEVLNKPDVVIMCSEIETAAASVKCEQCLDYFSLEGFAKVHSAGKRKLHTAVKCEQAVCSVYASEFATCEVDGMLYCDRAYEEIAGKSEPFRQKRCRILGGYLCSHYPGKKAEVLCEDCSDLFCWEAFIELHNHGNRRHHVPLRFNENFDLLRSGEILQPGETSRLLCRSRAAREGGPWLAFRDDQLNSYWYHLGDKVVSKQNPYL